MQVVAPIAQQDTHPQHLFIRARDARQANMQLRVPLHSVRIVVLDNSQVPQPVGALIAELDTHPRHRSNRVLHAL